MLWTTTRHNVETSPERSQKERLGTERFPDPCPKNAGLLTLGLMLRFGVQLLREPLVHQTGAKFRYSLRNEKKKNLSDKERQTMIGIIRQFSVSPLSSL